MPGSGHLQIRDVRIRTSPYLEMSGSGHALLEVAMLPTQPFARARSSAARGLLVVPVQGVQELVRGRGLHVEGLD